MADYGFDRLIYGFTRYRSRGIPWAIQKTSSCSRTRAKDYMDVFMGEGHYMHAPMVRWALANEGACSWRILAEMNREEGPVARLSSASSNSTQKMGVNSRLHDQFQVGLGPFQGRHRAHGARGDELRTRSMPSGPSTDG